jgi:SAM-dependent methyltransferase
MLRTRCGKANAAGARPVNKLDEIVAECLFHVAKRRAVLRRAGEGAQESAAAGAYEAWRQRSLEDQFMRLFDRRSIEGKDVLDFGCGWGALALAVSRLGARTVCGIDLNVKGIERATEAAAASGLAVEFRVASETDRIAFVDASFDTILCFDVLEHVIEYERIIPEWRRVLRPGGRVLIWWSPYFNPYGHHVQSYAPIPWMHVFASREVINKVCSKMVNLPEFQPPFWDLDEHGNRRDRFTGPPSTNFLNRLTIARFERLCAANRLRFARREFHTFRALKRFPLAQAVLTLPGLREFLSAYTVYELAAA